METNSSIQGGGCVRRVVVWGKQGGDVDPFQACHMKVVHGCVSMGTTTPGSTHCMQ